jgi:hypothetical protein
MKTENQFIYETKGSAVGKVWLEPKTEVAYFTGFPRTEEKLIGEIVETHIEEFKTKWNQYFSK